MPYKAAAQTAAGIVEMDEGVVVRPRLGAGVPSPFRSGDPHGATPVRLVLEHQGEHDSQWSAIPSVTSKLGCTAETLRKWVRQADSRFPPAFAGVTGNDVRARGACGTA